jgi:DNA polymerase-3 subunit epsilon
MALLQLAGTYNQALYTFNLLMEGYSLLKKMVAEFDLCPTLCFLHKEHISCASITNNKCKGACEKKESAKDYNSRVNSCIEHFQNELPTFAVVEEGFNEEEKSLVLIENGKFYGMGYVPESRLKLNISQIKSHLTPMAENDYIRGLIYSHAERFPLKKVELNCEMV